MPVLHLVSFPASDAYIKDRLVFEAAMKEMASAEGFLGAWHGIQTEDLKTGYFISAWETLEQHKKAHESPDYRKIIEASRPAMAGPPQREHVRINEHSLNALSAPVCAITFLTAKDGVDVGAARAKGANYIQEVDKAKGTHPPVLSGESIENEGKVISFVGWDSLQAHIDTVKAEPLATLVGPLRESLQINTIHCELRKYPSS